MEIQKEIKELREKLESLEKQISSKHEFAKGWNYIKVINAGFHQGWLVLNPAIDNDMVSIAISIDLECKTLYSMGSGILCRLDELKSHRPATPSEIKDALVKVCEKMGIVPGAIVKRPHNVVTLIGLGEKLETIAYDNFYYNPIKDSLIVSGVTVYYKGQFATVVKEEEIKIGGYKCEWTQDKDILKVGCKEFPYRWVADLCGIMKNFKINHVLIEHEEIELETVVKILNLRK